MLLRQKPALLITLRLLVNLAITVRADLVDRNVPALSLELVVHERASLCQAIRLQKNLCIVIVGETILRIEIEALVFFVTSFPLEILKGPDAGGIFLRFFPGFELFVHE